jgi:hypothetical protein
MGACTGELSNVKREDRAPGLKTVGRRCLCLSTEGRNSQEGPAIDGNKCKLKEHYKCGIVEDSGDCSLPVSGLPG